MKRSAGCPRSIAGWWWCSAASRLASARGGGASAAVHGGKVRRPALDRAREKPGRSGSDPRRGLVRRPSGLAGAWPRAGESASAAVPALLVAATVATCRAATLTAVSGAASASPLELADDGVFRLMAGGFPAGGVLAAGRSSWPWARPSINTPLQVHSPGYARSPALVMSRVRRIAEGPRDFGGERAGSSIEIRTVDQRTGKPLPRRRADGARRSEAGPARRPTTRGAPRSLSPRRWRSSCRWSCARRGSPRSRSGSRARSSRPRFPRHTP